MHSTIYHQRTWDSVQRDLNELSACTNACQQKATYKDTDSALPILDLGLQRRAERALRGDANVREVQLLELLQVVDLDVYISSAIRGAGVVLLLTYPKHPNSWAYHQR